MREGEREPFRIGAREEVPAVLGAGVMVDVGEGFSEGAEVMVVSEEGLGEALWE